MARIYVANSTRQKIEFHFRVPEVDKVIILPIGIGKQERVYREDLSAPEVDAIIHQLETGWGAVKSSDVDRTREFVGVCYSIDTPVKAAAIENAVEHNLGVLTQRGAEFRKQTAVAVNDALAAATPENALLESDMTIVEDVKRGEGSGMNETIQVRQEGRERPTPRRRKAA